MLKRKTGFLLNIVKLQEEQLIIMHIRRNKVGLVARVRELKSGVIRKEVEGSLPTLSIILTILTFFRFKK